MKRVPRLMAIRALGAEGELERWLAELASTGVDGVQIRDRNASDRELFQRCRAILAELPQAVSLIVNGRPDIAAAAGAAGVHLPASGLPTAAVREAFGGGLLIGRSTHSLAEVAAAQKEGADYVIFGPVYETPEKLRFGPPQGLDELRRACALGVPVVAIGGINEERLPEVAGAGAHGAAAIRLFDSPGRLTEVVESALKLFARSPAGIHD